MTKLQKPVARETFAFVRELGKFREVIVTLEPPNLIGFRLKGTRRTYYLEAASAYHAAVKAKVAADQREKRAARKSRSKR